MGELVRNTAVSFLQHSTLKASNHIQAYNSCKVSLSLLDSKSQPRLPASAAPGSLLFSAPPTRQGSKRSPASRLRLLSLQLLSLLSLSKTTTTPPSSFLFLNRDIFLS